MRLNKILICTLAIFIQLLTTGCKDDVADGLTGEVTIKSYMPTSVMSGVEMSITGTNLHQTSGIIFPGEIEVTDFEIVTSNLIKVIVPEGISPDGGKLKLIIGGNIVESTIAMRTALPRLTGIDPGDEIRELQELTFKGEDLDCIEKIMFPAAEEGEEIEMKAMSFLRKSSGNIKVIVPVGILSGMNRVKLVAYDGSVLESPEVNMLVAEKDPDGSALVTLQNVSSERYLSRNPSQTWPTITDYSGRDDQKFYFIPVPDNDDAYYIKNKSTDEYLLVGDENNWRMEWVNDPVTISDPAKGMYQIEYIGSTGLVQIRNLGSATFGIDSDDNDSEVYADKNGADNPKNQWRMEIISGSFERPTPTATIWEGELDFGEWYDFILEVDAFENLNVGSVIKIYIIPNEDGWSNFDLADVDWADFDGYAWKHPQDEWPDGIVKLPVDQNVYDRIMAGGLRIRGAYLTLTKVEIAAGEPAPAPTNNLWEGEQAFGDWFIVKIDAPLFGNLTEGDIIRMHYIPENGQYAQLDLRDKNDVGFQGMEWADMVSNWPDGIIDFVTDADACKRMKDGGLLIRGSHYTLTKVEIIKTLSDLYWEGAQEYGDWSVVTLDADLFGNLTPGDAIRMYYTPEDGQYAQLDLRDSNDVSFPGMEWADMTGKWPDGVIDFIVDQDACNRVQSGGLLIRGSHYTLTRVERVDASKL